MQLFPLRGDHCSLWSFYDVCIWVVRRCRLLVWRVAFCRHLVSFGKVISWWANEISHLPLSESKFFAKLWNKKFTRVVSVKIKWQNNKRMGKNSSNSGIAADLQCRDVGHTFAGKLVSFPPRPRITSFSPKWNRLMISNSGCAVNGVAKIVYNNCL